MSAIRRVRSAWLCGLIAVAAVALSDVIAGEGGRPLSLDVSAEVWTGDLDGMQRRRIIRVLVPYSKTIYFVDFGGTQRGLSYDFMRAFEKDLNARLGSDSLPVHAVFIPVARDQLLPALLSGRGDVVAANLTVTPERSQQVDFVTPLATGVKEIIVTGPGAPIVKTLDDLAGQDIYVQPTSSYRESLVALNQQLRQRRLAPMRLIDAPGHFETEDVLEMVNAGLVKTAVADDYLANLWRQVFPHLNVREDLAVRTDGAIAFAIRKNSPKLKAALDRFTVTHRQSTLFGNVLLQKYLQQTKWAKSALSKDELEKFTTLVALFRKYGSQYGVDWLLMAAQGYQESQLDQSRHSPVGAIGVMQLMPATGKEMKVGDIAQLEANIHAGIKYMRLNVDTYYQGEPVDDLNKMLFAFAAYNAGPARIRALRKEAALRGLDPNVWFNNVERIAAERIGAETVQYVSNIYKYYVAYTLVQEEVERDARKAADAARKPA